MQDAPTIVQSLAIYHGNSLHSENTCFVLIKIREGLKMALGHCLELSASYDITKDINLSAGFSYMKGTETMERLKRKSNKGDLRWAWITVVFSPRILNLKW